MKEDMRRITPAESAQMPAIRARGAEIHATPI